MRPAIARNLRYIAVAKGITKYFDLIGLTLANLYWRKIEEAETDFKTLSLAASLFN
jgi:hypothetical protein